MTKGNPTLQDLIDILALPNMGDEGRKAKLVAIKEWQITFLAKIEKEYLKESIQQDIWEILLLEPDLRCTCNEVIRETEIHQAKGHYHHCMLWQVARAVEISFRIMVDRDSFVFDESGKSGRFQTIRNKEM